MGSAGVAFVSSINDMPRYSLHAQAQMMRDEFLESPVSLAGVASLVGGRLEDGRPFLFLGFVVCSWRVGRINSIAQLRSRLGTIRGRFNSWSLPLLSV